MNPEEILKEGAKTYRKKEDDYGESWKLTGHLIWDMVQDDKIVLESPQDVIRFGLYTRRMDKIVRSINGEFTSGGMNYESIFDSHRDESVYAAMHASLFHSDSESEEREDKEQCSSIEEIDINASCSPDTIRRLKKELGND